MKKLLIVLFTLLSSLSHAQDKINYTSEELSINKHIDGTLLLPKDVKKQFADEDGKVNHDGLEFFIAINNMVSFHIKYITFK